MNQIAALQQQAQKLCACCPQRTRCEGAACTRVHGFLQQIDPLVSQYLRLELEEKKRLLGPGGSYVWQRRLPFGEGLDEMILRPRRPAVIEDADETKDVLYAWTEVAAAQEVSQVALSL